MPDPPSHAVAVAPPDAAPAEPSLPPLSAAGELVALPVAEFRDATVSVPLGATKPRPVLVALHGNFDRPEWQCEVWRGITKGYPFVLCPRGIPRGDVPKSYDRWEWASVAKTDKELEAALAALSDRFGAHIAPGPVLFTGFSLGAILGVGILKKHPDRYRAAVLTEGGFGGWSPAGAKLFAAAGGARVVFACGQADCLHKSRAALKLLERVGIEAHLADGGKAGHTYDGPVAQAIANEWSWLTAGDARWQP